MPPPPPKVRQCAPGATLLELIVALALVSALTAIAVTSLRAALDQLAVHGAVDELAVALGQARELAILRGGATVRIDAATGSLTVRSAGDLVTVRPLGARFGVSVEPSRDSLGYDLRGLGHGAANLRVVVRRGRHADTVVVSRLGRVRR